MPYMLDGRRLRVGRSFKTTDGATWTNQWATVLTEDEKTAAGITWVAEPESFDSNYYVSAGNPRQLDNGTDGEGNTTLGIRPSILQQQKQIAAGLLSTTDWYVTRKSETDTAIPSNVTTYRAAVRTACAARETEINAAANTAALETLMKTAPGKSGALTSWPDPLS